MFSFFLHWWIQNLSLCKLFFWSRTLLAISQSCWCVHILNQCLRWPQPFSIELHISPQSEGQTSKSQNKSKTLLNERQILNKTLRSNILICLHFLEGSVIVPPLLWFFPQWLQLKISANCGSLASSFHSLCASRLRRTFFAVQGSEEESSRQDRKWISVPISSRAPNSDPRRISNTMFYKLMFLEVRQGYPQPLRKRHTSSVSPKASDPKTTIGGCSNTTCVWFHLVESLIYSTSLHITVFFCLLWCHSHFCKASGTFGSLVGQYKFPLEPPVEII